MKYFTASKESGKGFVMRLFKSAALAFAMYSRIPMPQVPWEEKYLKHALCFLPLVGVVIGGLEIGWFLAARALAASPLFYAAIAALLPVLATGGLHIDGLMDTQDALSAFGEPEKRHAILKDPHAGAFAVIHGCLYFLLAAGCYAQLFEAGGAADALFAALGYVASRAVCALCVVALPCAKESGLAYIFKNGAGKKAVAATQIVLLVLAAAALVWLSFLGAAVFVVLAAACFLHFKRAVLPKFNGLTGDLAGFILTRMELVAGLAAVCGLLLRGVLGF